MEIARNRPHVLGVLRSVVLAGAGAVVWMALSSTAASADSGSSSNQSLLAGAGSAVTNVVHNTTAGLSGTLGSVASANVTPIPAPTSASTQVPADHLPVVQAPAIVVSELPQLTRTIEQLVAGTPVVNAVVPEGTVGTVITPVISSTVGTVDGVGTSVGTLLDSVVAPALGTIGSTVDALPLGSLPVTIPGITVTTPAIHIPGDGRVGTTPSEPSSVLNPLAGASTTNAISPLARAVSSRLASLAERYGSPGPSQPPWCAVVPLSGSGDPAGSGSPFDGTFPNSLPSGNHSGDDTAAFPSNPSGAAAAWLPAIILLRLLAGTLVSTAAAGQIPAPVSFDPGSSPD